MHTYMHTCTCTYMCKWTCTCMYACTIGEGATTSLLLCPCCLRKLQVLGVVTDVPACLARLHRLLSSEALREVSQADEDAPRVGRGDC